MQKTILLLGASGFIGRNLAASIERDSRYILHAPKRAQLDLLQSASCHEYLMSLRPDYVIHSAVDITSTENSLCSFFNVLNQHEHFGHIIQIGSGAEYNRATCGPLVQEQKFGLHIPTDSYGLSKYLISRELQSNFQGKATNFRLFGVFGNHENKMRRFISNNIMRVLSGYPISINQDMRFDYIDVQDFCTFLLDCLPNLPLSDVSYNFCRGTPHTLLEIAELLAKIMDVAQPIRVLKPGMNAEYSGSPTKIFSEIGRFSFKQLEESIVSLVEFTKNSTDSISLNSFRESLDVET